MNQKANLERQWTSIQFEVEQSQEELASWLMIQCGSRGCEVLDSKDGKRTIKSSFDTDSLSETAINDLTERLEEYGLAESLSTFSLQEFGDEDWLTKWKEGFVAFPVGERLMVCPAWLKDTIQPEPHRKRIIINPAMAFGTGLHATTRYCLKTIEEIEVMDRVLDVGTGSAILAIATALLHPAASVVALDNNEHAIENARENIHLNDMDSRIELILGEPKFVRSRKFDCILSNITCEDIVALLPEYFEFLVSGGKVICAGILQDKAKTLENAANSYGFAVVEKEISGEWAGLTLVRT